jgi:hypothetical protein
VGNAVAGIVLDAAHYRFLAVEMDAPLFDVVHARSLACVLQAQLSQEPKTAGRSQQARVWLVNLSTPVGPHHLRGGDSLAALVNSTPIRSPSRHITRASRIDLSLWMRSWNASGTGARPVYKILAPIGEMFRTLQLATEL